MSVGGDGDGRSRTTGLALIATSLILAQTLFMTFVYHRDSYLVRSELASLHLKSDTLGAALVPEQEGPKRAYSGMEFDNSSEIVFAVLGKGKKFSKWFDLFQGLKESFKVTLVYGSDDAPINSTQCTTETDCRTMFMPNTTWTEGRNKLAEAILCQERARGKRFKWWAFAEDDVELLKCQFSAWSCWHAFLYSLSNHMPSNSVVVSASSAIQRMGSWYGLTTFDSALNVFKRDFLPLLLPYATLPEGVAQEVSQFALFCTMTKCFKGGGVEIPARIPTRNDTTVPNHEHIVDVFNISYSPFLKKDEAAACSPTHLHLDEVGPFGSAEELAPFIPPVRAMPCSGLMQRFHQWERMIRMC